MQTAGGTPQGNVLRIGRVVKSYSKKHVVDVVFLDDGGFASGVPMSTQWGSQDHGFHYLPEVQDPSDGHWSPELSDENDSLALIGYFSGQPFVVGSVFPADPKAEMSKLPDNVLMIKAVTGAYLEMDQRAMVTLKSEWGKRGQHGFGSCYLILEQSMQNVTLANATCKVQMDMFGTLKATSGAGNIITMDGQSGAITMTSGGGASVVMGADGILQLNPPDPSAPV